MPRLALLFLLTAAAAAQRLITADEASRIAVPKTVTPLTCQVAALRPVLDFSLRFQAGYTVRVPLSQYRGAGHHWEALVRIQPEGGKPSFFLEHRNLPTVPETRAVADLGGGYWMGEGRYNASLVMLDDEARVCRAEWSINARLDTASRGVRMTILPGAVQEMSLRSSVHTGTPAATGHTMTVLLHAAPVSLRASGLQANDAVILMGALSSLLSLAPGRTVRLIVFSLDQQREIYRRENFTADQMEAVRQALFELQLSTVDYHVLQNQSGDLELLGRLVAQASTCCGPSDTVVFLGPRARAIAKPDSAIALPSGAIPKFFYLEYLAPRRVTPDGTDDFSGVGTSIANQTKQAIAARAAIGDGGTGRFVIPDSDAISAIDGSPGSTRPRDSIDLLVSRLKGKTFIVNTPADFAKAVARILP